MSTNFSCKLCNKEYKTNTGLWLHNKKYHSDPNKIVVPINANICRYCHGEYACKQSRWKHEQKCKITTEEKIL